MKRFLLWFVLGFLVAFCFAAATPSKKVNLCENMVDSSVLIYNEYGSFGAGVFIDDNVILTAGHVLQANIHYIELTDGTVLTFDDFYIDNEEDIGFIFVDADELCISEISKSQNELGDIVYLVGTPYNKDFKFTITKGILSHLDRDIRGEFDWQNLLQTDAEGAPGSSGGPLYNIKGEVIGICVTGANPGGGVALCESAESILEAYERCIDAR